MATNRTGSAATDLQIGEPATAGFGNSKSSAKPDSRKQLTLGLVFGIVFGFLLQKGGVATYEILLGSLLLTDFK